MATKIQFRRDTAANWTAANPILSIGEIGYETDTATYKIGDGSSLWSALTYIAQGLYAHPTGDGNLHIPATSTTNDGKVLTAGPTAGSLSWETPISQYVHPTGDGNLHVPANGTTNNGKFLTAGATAGALTWETFAADFTGDVVTQAESDNHTRLGVGAGSALTTQDAAFFETYMGFEAGKVATGMAIGGSIGIGYQALRNTTTGGNNIAIGYQTLFTNITASNNIAIGFQALYDLTTGDNNIAIGYLAGNNITQGIGNINIGWNAGPTSTTGNYNVMVGYYAGRYHTGAFSNNTFIGFESGYRTSDAIGCTYIGSSAGYWVADGDRNVAIGTDALYSATGANVIDDCVAVGYQALYSIKTSSQQVAIGARAGYNTITGTNNTFMGYYAGYTMAGSTDSNNTLIGCKSGEFLNGGTGNNTFVGFSTGATITTGSNNTIIGASADSIAAASSQIIIGQALVGTTNNRVHIGNATNHIHADFNSSATWTYTSDERTKNFHRNSRLGLDFINALQPKEYTWKPVAEWPIEFGKTDCAEMDTRLNHGVSAQAIKAAMDACGVEDFAGWGLETNGMQTVGESALVFPLINAVNELTHRVKKLEIKAV